MILPLKRTRINSLPELRAFLRNAVATLLLFLLSFLVPARGQDGPFSRRDFVHDPSTIVKCQETFWVFSTGNGISSRHSCDLVHWEKGPPVFTIVPPWCKELVPGNRGYLWAPDVVQRNGQYWLYYSVSTWGSKQSAIGLVTSPTLDPTATNFHWTDRGPVIQSGAETDFNAIDPCVTTDTAGNLWLGFGSYWSGIKLVQLNPTTGERLSTNSPVYSLAHHDSIEAAFVQPHDGFFYLFVNWGQCCRGTNSTYNIRVGRGRAITGPYLDKDGVDMLEGGGSLFMESAGRFIGPGHAGVFVEGTTNWFSFHFYDAERRGLATLGLRPLRWGKDGWSIPPADK